MVGFLEDLLYVVRENDNKKPKFIFCRFIAEGSKFFLC